MNDETDIPEDILDYTEQELEDELDIQNEFSALLNKLTLKEKQRLLAFKQKVNQIEWESELSRLHEVNQKTQDLARLKQMSGSALPSQEVSKRRASRLQVYLYITKCQ